MNKKLLIAGGVIAAACAAGFTISYLLKARKGVFYMKKYI